VRLGSAVVHETQSIGLKAKRDTERAMSQENVEAIAFGGASG
jgi:hypothetical protein